MRLFPHLLHARPLLSGIAISQEEITADLLYPAPAPDEGRGRPSARR
jgi:hypothetical protein